MRLDVAGDPTTAEPHTLVVKLAAGGFFSNFNRVVSHLCHSLGRDGCVAVRVDWRVAQPLPEFAHATPADGNAWDHFFEPLRFPGRPSLERSTHEYADYGMTGLRAYRMYKRGGAWRTELGQAFATHVRVRREIAQRAESIGRPQMADSFCVGVHLRHPGHDHECPRPAPPIEAVVARVRRLIGERRAVVVLATDVEEIADSFHAAFGERLVVQPNVVRTRASGSQLHHEQPAPRLELGEQVLIDALLLAGCDVLLHTVSNVATAVGYMNPTLRMVYCEPALKHVLATMRARVTRGPPASSAEGLSRRPKAC